MRQVEVHGCLHGFREVRSVLVICACQWTAVPVTDETAGFLTDELVEFRCGEIREVSLVVH